MQSLIYYFVENFLLLKTFLMIMSMRGATVAASTISYIFRTSGFKGLWCQNCIKYFLSFFFQCVIAWIMLIPESSNFSTLVTYFNFAAWTFYGATIAALLWLRFKEPDLKRPYKVNMLYKSNLLSFCTHF